MEGASASSIPLASLPLHLRSYFTIHCYSKAPVLFIFSTALLLSQSWRSGSSLGRPALAILITKPCFLIICQGSPNSRTASQRCHLCCQYDPSRVSKARGLYPTTFARTVRQHRHGLTLYCRYKLPQCSYHIFGRLERLSMLATSNLRRMAGEHHEI